MNIYCLGPLLDQCYIIVIFTYCFLASNIAGPVGGTIGSVFILIIVAFICCVTAIGIKKKPKRQNLRSDNTQQVDLQTISSPETIQRKKQTGLYKPLPNIPMNTIPQRQNQYPGNETGSAHYPENNCRPPNVGNWEAPSDVLGTFNNPAYEFSGGSHEQSDYEIIDEAYKWGCKVLKIPSLQVTLTFL